MRIDKYYCFYPRINNSWGKQSNKILNYSDWNYIGGLIIDEGDIEKYTNLINNIISNSSLNNLGKNVYLGTLSELPRHKVKDYFNSKKINKTSRIEQADSIIVNKMYLDEIKEYFNHLQTDEIYEINSKLDIEWVLDNVDEFEYDSEKKYIIKHIEEFKSIPLYLQDKPIKKITYYKWFKENKRHLINLLHFIENNPQIPVILDEHILGELNKEGIELDDDYLSMLDNMFSSKDQDNINMALEMMSNIDIENNLLKISLFLNKHAQNFVWGSGLTLNNNKSFKSIQKYLKNKNIEWNKDWRLFVEGLYKNFKNDEQSINIIDEFTKQNINKYLSENSNLHLQSLDLTIK